MVLAAQRFSPRTKGVSFIGRKAEKSGARLAIGRRISDHVATLQRIAYVVRQCRIKQQRSLNRTTMFRAATQFNIAGIQFCTPLLFRHCLLAS
jgi:hypothetical protein